ncbi:glycosyltransferase [Marinicauda algicola]|uniref:Glycosyltransferase n=1 Tax=Marinicauda algicola TaxID=2029849 RepID=A0A4S2H3V7_9PROT|nr:glycosyltransferase [Marinicauda algicola]TGY90315.1 glycosyltransferase [Marinicauda algicola]
MKARLLTLLRSSALGRGLIEFAAERLAGLRRSGFVHGRFPRYRAWHDTVHARGACSPTNGPLISVLIPAFNPDSAHFRAMIASLQAQTYSHFEALICDDGSSAREAFAYIAEAADPRIRLIERGANGGISAATNTALEQASGEFTAFLDQDDSLAPDALAAIATAFAREPDAILVYTDEDKLDRRGRPCEPYFKPVFDRALLYRRNYINHLTAIRTGALRALGGLDGRYDGAQDYDLVLRVLERHGPQAFAHMPRVAYHWRTGRWARSLSQTRAGQVAAARKAALEAHLTRLGQSAEIFAGAELDVRWPVPAQTRVSVIIPTRDRLDLIERCVREARASAEGVVCEWILVDNDSVEQDTIAWFEREARRADTRVVRAPGGFNFSHLVNTGAAQARGELLLILNNDVYGGNPGWILAMAGEALRPWAGPVGAQLLYPDGRLQHGGIALGLGGVAGHVMKGAKPGEAGPFGHLALTRTVSAVTGACLMVRRAVFDAVGGFDAEAFPIALNDVDFCLRTAKAGYETVWTPHARLYHREGASRGRETAEDARFAAEIAHFRARWEGALKADPYLNPNLDPSAELLGLDWQIADRCKTRSAAFLFL